MIVLGIDGGMTRLGFGAVEINDSLNLRFITHGFIYNPRGEMGFTEHLNSGILRIANDLPRLLDLVHPDVIYSETIPPGKLGSSSSTVIAAVTTCKVISFQFGIDWIDIAASTVKKDLTGDGRATKAVVRNHILGMFDEVAKRHALLKSEQKDNGEKSVGLPQDVFDGLAVAVIGAKRYVTAEKKAL